MDLFYIILKYYICQFCDKIIKKKSISYKKHYFYSIQKVGEAAFIDHIQQQKNTSFIRLGREESVIRFNFHSMDQAETPEARLPFQAVRLRPARSREQEGSGRHCSASRCR